MRIRANSRGGAFTRPVVATSAAVLALAVAAPLAAQDAVPISRDQFGYGTRAVADTNLKVDIFGGGDENGGLFGGAPSLAIPLGDSFGLQADGVAGFVADEVGFAGGAAQLYYRDPQTFAAGVAGGGYYIDGQSQYAVAAIAEYYLANITLEALAGWQWGDVVGSSFYGRAGASLFVTPDFRVGAGVAFAEDTRFAGDLQLEALLQEVPGMALFATGVLDEKGVMGLAGIRFYTGASDLDHGPGKASGGPTLIEITRNLQRPNFLTGYGGGFGLRQISMTGGGELPVEPPPPPPPPPVTGNGGLITLVQNTVDNLVGNTPLDAVSKLVDALVDPKTGVLSILTNPLDKVTDIKTGQLGAVTQVVDTLAGPTQGLLDPTLDAVNDLLSGNKRATTTGGLIDTVQGTVSGLLGNTPLSFVSDLVAGLVDPQTGVLSALTGPLNSLTNVQTGKLGALTEVVDTLVGQQNGALTPTLNAVNDLLSGDSRATSNAGLIDGVLGTVDNLLGGTPLAFVTDVVAGLAAPSGSLLAPLTGPLNDITRGQTGQLGAVTTLVGTLVDRNDGALDPTLDGVNRLLSF
ncbi:hypothetical protein [Zavarzinia sp.]|uniref:hypothetical protein n=1 Tax=Zavarzinia sp. TaxID=2027920 RepID=UPI0035677616